MTISSSATIVSKRPSDSQSFICKNIYGPVQCLSFWGKIQQGLSITSHTYKIYYHSVTTACILLHPLSLSLLLLLQIWWLQTLVKREDRRNWRTINSQKMTRWHSENILSQESDILKEKNSKEIILRKRSQLSLVYSILREEQLLS